MRTSLELPDKLFREIKTLAVQRGVTLKELIRIALERELQRRQEHDSSVRVLFPLLESKEPGTLTLTNAEIEDLLT